MNCALYARLSVKSRHQTGDEDSIPRQIAECRAFAEQRGWTTSDGYVFSDTESGAEFSRRPGLMRLVAALKPAPPFDALLIVDRDRLGREQIEASFVLKTIITAGVQVFEVRKSDAPVTLATPIAKVLQSVQAFAGEVESAQSRSRTYAALLHRVREGRSVGGRLFGYTGVCAACGAPTVPRSCLCEKAGARRVVNEQEAAVIRQAFALASQGHGVKAIARRLNAEGALAPSKTAHAPGRGWTPSTVRTLLHNTSYGGTVTWSRTKKRNEWGERRPSRRPASDVERIEVPSLRIIDAATWAAAHAKLNTARALYEATIRPGLAPGRPASGAPAKYLLSGLGECGTCGGGMFVHRRGDHADRWGCQTRHLRGASVCANKLEVRRDDADAAVVAAVRHDLLRVEVIETAMAKALAALDRDGRDDHAADQRLVAELSKLDAEVARLSEAIARGGSLESLLAALADREKRRAHVRQALAEQQRQRSAERLDRDEVVALMREAIERWQTDLTLNVAHARPALQALLAGRLTFKPTPDGYEFSAPGTVQPVVEGIVAKVSKGSGARTRAIPPAIRRALLHRDHGCRFPGCGVRARPGPSHPSLGARRPDDAWQSGAAVPSASPGGARRRLSG